MEDRANRVAPPETISTAEHKAHITKALCFHCGSRQRRNLNPSRSWSTKVRQGRPPNPIEADRQRVRKEPARRSTKSSLVHKHANWPKNAVLAPGALSIGKFPISLWLRSTLLSPTEVPQDAAQMQGSKYQVSISSAASQQNMETWKLFLRYCKRECLRPKFCLQSCSLAWCPKLG